eukprot:gene16654-22905_t
MSLRPFPSLHLSPSLRPRSLRSQLPWRLSLLLRERTWSSERVCKPIVSKPVIKPRAAPKPEAPKPEEPAPMEAEPAAEGENMEQLATAPKPEEGAGPGSCQPGTCLQAHFL